MILPTLPSSGDQFILAHVRQRARLQHHSLIDSQIGQNSVVLLKQFLKWLCGTIVVEPLHIERGEGAVLRKCLAQGGDGQRVVLGGRQGE